MFKTLLNFISSWLRPGEPTRSEANCLRALAAKGGQVTDADDFTDFWLAELITLDRKGLASGGGGFGAGWRLTRAGAAWIAQDGDDRATAPAAGGLAVGYARKPHDEA